MFVLEKDNHVIDCGNETKHLRIKAEERNVLYHYCSIDSLKSILNEKRLLLKCLNDYSEKGEYEKFGISNDYSKSIFISCFSSNGFFYKFWRYFADDSKGVKLEFGVKDAFHKEVFDFTKMAEAFIENGEVKYEFGFSISEQINNSRLSCDPNFFTKPIVDIILTDAIYRKNLKKPILKYRNFEYLNLSEISRQVVDNYKWQDESRIIGILRTTETKVLEDISYIKMPLDFRNTKMYIKFGKRVSKVDRDEIINIINHLKKEGNYLINYS
ncbi:MAG: hypothetical protein ACK5L6_01025 [Anaerorhabdus sp.]|uniref:hypothetical protein n=1 Tax=Anaerorhabdus sp. TaxID=1872524 RepID=UPI003A861AEA